MHPSPVVIQKHAPERRRKAVTTLHCGCTCCCCCCLHTVGSIVCAAVAPALGKGGPMPLTHYYDDEDGIQIPSIKRPGFSAVTIFWWVTCFLIFLCFAYGILQEGGGGGGGENILITGVVVLLILPGLQLFSAAITLFVFLCWPRYDKSYQMGQIGKISAGVVIGSLLGILAMTVIGFGLAALSK
jgi:hypothetical protein